MLAETRKDFTIPKGQVSELSPDMAFSDYMRYWLKMMRTAVTETTYSSYCFNVEKHIIPYFELLGVTLAGLQPRQIQSFYLHEAETLKNTSILRFHANLHKALKYAVRIDLITSNPVDKVDRPKPQAFMASYYSAEEMEKLFEAAQGHKLELIIQLAAFYGLRRAEVMGLRWEAIDFEAKTLTIRHIVTSTRIDGKKILVEADRAKTKSSLRTLPLVDPIAERLKAVKEQQEYNQKICGNCYNQEYLGYVFVDAMGNLIQPDSVTTGFPQLLKENGLRRIRFHDLRHPYVKHTTKKYNSEKQKTQATKMDLIAWVFRFIPSIIQRGHGFCKQSQCGCRGIHTPFQSADRSAPRLAHPLPQSSEQSLAGCFGGPVLLASALPGR